MRKRSVGTSIISHKTILYFRPMLHISFTCEIDCMTTSAPIFVVERPIGRVTIIALVLSHVAQSLRRMMFKFAYREGINVWAVVLM